MHVPILKPRLVLALLFGTLLLLVVTHAHPTLEHGLTRRQSADDSRLSSQLSRLLPRQVFSQPWASKLDFKNFKVPWRGPRPAEPAAPGNAPVEGSVEVPVEPAPIGPAPIDPPPIDSAPAIHPGEAPGLSEPPFEPEPPFHDAIDQVITPPDETAPQGSLDAGTGQAPAEAGPGTELANNLADVGDTAMDVVDPTLPGIPQGAGSSPGPVDGGAVNAELPPTQPEQPAHVPVDEEDLYYATPAEEKPNPLDQPQAEEQTPVQPESEPGSKPPVQPEPETPAIEPAEVAEGASQGGAEAAGDVAAEEVVADGAAAGEATLAEAAGEGAVAAGGAAEGVAEGATVGAGVVSAEALSEMGAVTAGSAASVAAGEVAAANGAALAAEVAAFGAETVVATEAVAVSAGISFFLGPVGLVVAGVGLVAASAAGVAIAASEWDKMKVTLSDIITDSRDKTLEQKCRENAVYERKGGLEGWFDKLLHHHAGIKELCPHDPTEKELNKMDKGLFFHNSDLKNVHVKLSKLYVYTDEADKNSTSHNFNPQNLGTGIIVGNHHGEISTRVHGVIGGHITVPLDAGSPQNVSGMWFRLLNKKERKAQSEKKGKREEDKKKKTPREKALEKALKKQDKSFGGLHKDLRKREHGELTPKDSKLIDDIFLVEFCKKFSCDEVTIS